MLKCDRTNVSEGIDIDKKMHQKKRYFPLLVLVINLINLINLINYKFFISTKMDGKAIRFQKKKKENREGILNRAKENY